MTLLLLLLALATAQAKETFAGRDYYWGDLHSHTCVTGNGKCVEEANCALGGARCGALADVFTRSVTNGLDFVSFTDRWNSPAADSGACPGVTCSKGYNPLLALCRAAKTASFICLPGVELEISNDANTSAYGHRTVVVFQDTDATLAGLSITQMGTRPTGVTNANCGTQSWTPMTALAAFGAPLGWAHHPASINIMTADWRCHNATYEPVVEVYSGWGTGLNRTYGYDDVYQGSEVNDGDTGDVAPDIGSVFTGLETFGMKVGFLAGSDNHDTRPGEMCDRADDGTTNGQIYSGGLTMISRVAASPFVPSAIKAELDAKRTLATTGPLIPVSVVWTTSDAATHTPGETIDVEQLTSTTLTVTYPAADDASVTGVQAVGYSMRIPLARTVAGTYTVSIKNTTLPSWLYLEVAINGATYAPSCTNDGGADTREFIWSSPAWFHAVDTSSMDADSDRWTRNVDCDDTNAAIHPLAVEVLNNGIDEDCSGADSTGTAPVQ